MRSKKIEKPQFNICAPRPSVVRQVSSTVIPVMVESMSLDEGNDCEDAMASSNDLDREFQSDYQRSPSDTSGYETDPNLINDVTVVVAANEWNDNLPDDLLRETQADQLQQLENLDIVAWLESGDDYPVPLDSAS